MKLPLFQKIEINTTDVAELCTIFKKNNLSAYPTILLFDRDKLDDKSLTRAIKACKAAFERCELNPLLPYSTYIVSRPGHQQHYFPEIKDIHQAPKHFRKKIKKLKKREAVLLAKATTYSERIQNHNLVEDIAYIKEKGSENKILQKLCSEKDFYIKLLEEINGDSSVAQEGDQS